MLRQKKTQHNKTQPKTHQKTPPKIPTKKLGNLLTVSVR